MTFVKDVSEHEWTKDFSTLIITVNSLLGLRNNKKMYVSRFLRKVFKKNIQQEN